MTASSELFNVRAKEIANKIELDFFENVVLSRCP